MTETEFFNLKVGQILRWDTTGYGEVVCIITREHWGDRMIDTTVLLSAGKLWGSNIGDRLNFWPGNSYYLELIE